MSWRNISEEKRGRSRRKSAASGETERSKSKRWEDFGQGRGLGIREAGQEKGKRQEVGALKHPS